MVLDVIAASRYYVDKLVSDPNNPGMKVLLLDEATTKSVSMVYSQTQILEKDIYLVEHLERARRHEPMRHLKATVFVRPTPANLELLKAELADPKFCEYHIFFSNVCPPDLVNALADADESELVRQVQEYYGDYVAVNEELFTLNQRYSLRLSAAAEPAATAQLAELLHRNVSAVLSALLSLKSQPCSIRYQGTSRVARAVAEAAGAAITADGIFHFARGSDVERPLLLILDRADDPVTPLLSQWTYQAMVHELLGLNNNRVKIKVEKASATNPMEPAQKAEEDEAVLSCTQDAFFAKHRHSNFGDLGMAVKQLLDDYQHQSRLNEKVTTVEDMQSFMQRYPAFRSQSLNFSKHLALTTELSRLVDACELMDVSQLEQELACNDDASTQWRALQDHLRAPRIKTPDKLRLSLLYALRYEGSQNVDRLRQLLDEARVPPEKVALLTAILKYAGKAQRGPGLYGSGSSLMSKVSKAIAKGLEGIENVYTQHVPLLIQTLGDVAKGKLKDAHYPAVGTTTASTTAFASAAAAGGGGGPNAAKQPGLPPMKSAIVFIVGGVTYEEATKVAELNHASTNGLKVILGGSYIHNSTSFLDDLNDAFGPGRA